MSTTQPAETAQADRQSRVGKRPVIVPKGVEFSGDATVVRIKGPKGSLERKLPPFVGVKKDGEQLIVAITSNATGEGPKYQGLTRPEPCSTCPCALPNPRTWWD